MTNTVLLFVGTVFNIVYYDATGNKNYNDQ